MGGRGPGSLDATDRKRDSSDSHSARLQLTPSPPVALQNTTLHYKVRFLYYAILLGSDFGVRPRFAHARFLFVRCTKESDFSIPQRGGFYRAHFPGD